MSSKFLKKLNTSHVILICLIVIVLSALATVLIYKHSTIVEVQEFETNLIIGDTVGMNVDSDKIWFGSIPKGRESSSTRRLFITNTYEFPIEVTAKTEGEMKDWIYMPNQKMIIEPGYGNYFYLIASPEGYGFFPEIGEYEGSLTLYLKKAPTK